MYQLGTVFGFLNDMRSFRDMTSKQAIEHWSKLQEALRNEDSRDIDAAVLWSEMQTIARRLPKLRK